MRRLTLFVPLALAASLAACSTTPTATDDIPVGLTVAPLPDLSPVFSEMPGQDGRNASPAPLLGRLVGMAIGKVRDNDGPEAAARLMQAVQARQGAVRQAVAAGNPEAVRQAKRALDEFSARIVVSVFGPGVVPHVIGTVGEQVRNVAQMLERAAADGRDVSGPRRILGAIMEMLAGARAALQAGHPVPALLQATHASDVVHTLFGGDRAGG